MERYIYSFGSSFAVAVLLTALVFVTKALVPGLEEWAEEMFGHAWFYMGVLALALFIILGLTRVRFASSGHGLATLVGSAAVASGVVIVAVSAYVAAIE